jgi:RNA polymerase sigma-70 factor, ECF subfamily
MLRLSRRRPPSADEDGELVERLRGGEERAFVDLVARHHAAMLRLAASFVSSRAVAEEVVQDTWVGVLRGVGGFAGRSSFKTWLLRILVNRARTTAAREGRTLALGDPAPAVDSARFDSAGGWSSPPRHWSEESEDRLFAEGLGSRLSDALSELPERQRQVVILRDLDELDSQEVCEVLEISQANQRVLLHRGRSRLRQALEEELEPA